ncbi:TIGR02281 family clan AA aspartic protease [Bremerella sp.]|uniref:TIGR02281 family clan AA aspartic protease n=1 Tax=Bremerella sp. TaxID=2795602 RepID=UPI003918C9E3
MPSKVSLSMTVVLLLLFASIASARTWKSADGGYSVEAELVKVDGDKVALKRADGQTITVPLNRLSTEDQEFIKSQSVPAPDASMEDAATKALEEKGLRALSRGLILDDETKFSKEERDSSKFKRVLFTKDKELATIKKQEAMIRERITGMTQANVQFNAQLTQLGPTDITLNNRLVGAINANVAQIRLMEQQLIEIEKAAKNSRAEASKAREDYIEHILGLRKLADSINNRYAELAADPTIKETVSKLNSTSENSYELGASTAFKSALIRLKSMEDSILSEEIPLRDDGGNAMMVSVVINGEHNVEMHVDSGASLISLPFTMAAKCGIQVTSEDPEIILELADGSRITAHVKTIPLVRVGKFEVKDVECAVLSPAAVNAAPLLGMSFLGQFKFELDAQKGVLNMVKIETESTSSRSR